MKSQCIDKHGGIITAQHRNKIKKSSRTHGWPFSSQVIFAMQQHYHALLRRMANELMVNIHSDGESVTGYRCI